MELTLKDRVLILNNVLPMYDNRKNIGLKISISEKVQLSDTEQKDIVTTPVGNGEFEVSFKTVDAMTGIRSFDFTDDELMYLKQRVDFIDRNGMFSAETIESYTKILDEPFVSVDKQAEWNKAQGIDTGQ
ncbi:hypothetical protein [Parabacteroides provencensis]|uniref:hypothetical protein n=1 Tax=Parabacteroides provencensis TaxID=1944636 RepID=UPI000C15D116|nr:hypothetical protein [Parabacteroides provencensis]